MPLLLVFLTTYFSHTLIILSSIQCTALSLVLPRKPFYLASTSYTSSSSLHWSKQEGSLAPRCIVAPTTTNDVASTVKRMTSLNKIHVLRYSFAIPGGGHTRWASTANIDSGVPIDMRATRGFSVNAYKSVTSV